MIDKDVQELLEAAEQYLVFARERLGVNLHPSGPEAFSPIETMARLLFLFPQVREKKLELVAAVEAAKAGVDFATPNQASGPVCEANKMDWEKAFVKFRRDVVRSGIFDEVTPIQRRLLEQHYPPPGGRSGPLIGLFAV